MVKPEVYPTSGKTFGGGAQGVPHPPPCAGYRTPHIMRLPRRDALLKPFLAAALASPAALFDPRAATAATLPAAAPRKPTTEAAVTQKVFLDLRIIKRFDVEVLEDAAVRGRLEIGLFGKDAPLATKRFIEFIEGTTGQFAKNAGGPAYSSATIDNIKPLTLVQGGKIAGLRQTSFAGTLEWEYLSRLLPNLTPVLEVNDLSHDRRGLLTVERFNNGGPDFGITLSNVPALDDTREVIGYVMNGAELLEEIEGLPFITGRSIEEPGSVGDEVFKAQKSLFSGLSKGIGDARAEDRTGKILRRVEITKCGLL